jgi:hypothetical protein
LISSSVAVSLVFVGNFNALSASLIFNLIALATVSFSVLRCLFLACHQLPSVFGFKALFVTVLILLVSSSILTH